MNPTNSTGRGWVDFFVVICYNDSLVRSEIKY